jgi:hypothetical protein
MCDMIPTLIVWEFGAFNLGLSGARIIGLVPLVLETSS